MNEIPTKNQIPPQTLYPDDDKYLKGRHNQFIRFYFYLESGMALLDQFRNMFLAVIALYFTLKLENPLWMVVMIIPGMIIMTLLGRYNIHKLSKMKEWLGLRFSSHFAIRSFNYNQKQYELLEEIRDLLKKQNDSR